MIEEKQSELNRIIEHQKQEIKRLREAIEDLEICEKHEFDGNTGERFAVMYQARLSFAATRKSHGQSRVWYRGPRTVLANSGHDAS